MAFLEKTGFSPPSTVNPDEVVTTSGSLIPPEPPVLRRRGDQEAIPSHRGPSTIPASAAIPKYHNTHNIGHSRIAGSHLPGDPRSSGSNLPERNLIGASRDLLRSNIQATVRGTTPRDDDLQSISSDKSSSS